MYKKITHTIVEEHFNHPAAADIKAYLDHTQKSTAQNFNQIMQLRVNSRNHFSRLQSRIKNYVRNLAEPRDDATTAMTLDNVKSSIDDLRNDIVPFYGEAASDEFKTRLTDFISKIAEYVKLIKMSQDTTAIDAQLTKAKEDLAKFLSTANPTYWPVDAVTKIFSDYAAELLAQARAQLRKDGPGIINSENKQHDIIMGDLKGAPGLADIFSSGILKQFPEKFQ